MPRRWIAIYSLAFYPSANYYSYDKRCLSRPMISPGIRGSSLLVKVVFLTDCKWLWGAVQICQQPMAHHKHFLRIDKFIPAASESMLYDVYSINHSLYSALLWLMHYSERGNILELPFKPSWSRSHKGHDFEQFIYDCQKVCIKTGQRGWKIMLLVD